MILRQFHVFRAPYGRAAALCDAAGTVATARTQRNFLPLLGADYDPVGGAKNFAVPRNEVNPGYSARSNLIFGPARPGTRRPRGPVGIAVSGGPVPLRPKQRRRSYSPVTVGVNTLFTAAFREPK